MDKSVSSEIVGQDISPPRHESFCRHTCPICYTIDSIFILRYDDSSWQRVSLCLPRQWTVIYLRLYGASVLCVQNALFFHGKFIIEVLLELVQSSKG